MSMDITGSTTVCEQSSSNTVEVRFINYTFQTFKYSTTLEQARSFIKLSY